MELSLLQGFTGHNILRLICIIKSLGRTRQPLLKSKYCCNMNLLLKLAYSENCNIAALFDRKCLLHNLGPKVSLFILGTPLLVQGFFWPFLTTDIRSCSQCQKVCFFPNLNKKIPNSRNKKKNGRKNNKISPFYDDYVCG